MGEHAFCLTREQLDAICAEQGIPVASHEWDKGLEHGLRVAFAKLDSEFKDHCICDECHSYRRGRVAEYESQVAERDAKIEDLLAALENLLGWSRAESAVRHGHADTEFAQRLFAKAEAAIAKARGQGEATS